MGIQIIQQSFEVINPWGAWIAAFKHIEKMARICYQSEGRSTEFSYENMIKKLIRNGHGAMLEHAGFTVMFRTDRAIANELVRHRMASFAQESTRYCNYGGNDIQVVVPDNITMEQYVNWLGGVTTSVSTYQALIDSGCTPEQARDVLPLCTATTIAVTANMREWVEVIFPLRDSPAAHPKMQKLMHELLVYLVNDGAELMFGHLLNK